VPPAGIQALARHLLKDAQFAEQQCIMRWAKSLWRAKDRNHNGSQRLMIGILRRFL
jgi:hypothetical protein